MNLLRKLASETALYGLPSILGRSVYFLLVILHTDIFPAGQSGIMNELYAYVAFMNVIYTYGMETSFFRFATKYDSKTYYNLILTAIVISSGLLSGIIILFSSSIAGWLNYPDKGVYIIWLALVVAIDAVVVIPFARLRLEKNAKWFASVRMINIVLNVLFNLFFLLFCRDVYEGKYLIGLQPLISKIYFPEIGVGYVFLANLLANLAFFPLLFKQIQDFRFQFDFKLFKPVFIYGYPILIMGLGGVANQMFDRTALKYLLPAGFYPKYTSQEALGIYGSVYKLSVFMNLAVQAFRYAAEPFFFSQANDKNSPQLFATIMKWFVIACCVIWVGVSVNLDLIGSVFLRRAEYREGLLVVPFLLLGNLFLGVYYNLSVWFKLTDKTYYGTYITIFGAFTNIALNFILIPVSGYTGCAIAFAISCMAMTVACYILGEKFYPIPYPIKRILIYIISANILIMISLRAHFENFFVQLLFHSAICLTFGALIYVLERKKKAVKQPS